MAFWESSAKSTASLDFGSINLHRMLEEVGLKLPEIGDRPLRWHSLCSEILTSAPMIELHKESKTEVALVKLFTLMMLRKSE